MSLVADTATLVHGYTMAEIDRCKHTAIRQHPSTVLAPQDRHEVAWHAIVDELYRSRTRPDWWILVTAGVDGLRQATRQELKHRGFNDQGGFRPKFMAYWGETHDWSDVGDERPTRTNARLRPPDFTESMIEIMALPQVMALLTGPEYEALVDLAAHGSVSAAAAASGMKSSLLSKRVNQARERIKIAWFEPDLPPAGRKGVNLEESCQNGHRRAEHSVKNSRGLWKCRKCLALRDRRVRARGEGRSRTKSDPHEVVGAAIPMTFAPPRDVDVDAILTGADYCWCGMPYGHDWAGKDAGVAHPRSSAA